MVLRIWGEKGTDSYCLMGTEFQFYKIKSLEMDSGDSFTSLWLYLISMNHLIMVTMVNIFYHSKKKWEKRLIKKNSNCTKPL